MMLFQDQKQIWGVSPVIRHQGYHFTCMGGKMDAFSDAKKNEIEGWSLLMSTAKRNRFSSVEHVERFRCRPLAFEDYFLSTW